MKEGTLDLATCPLLTIADVGMLCRNLELAKRGAYHGWLKPCVRTAESTRGYVLYQRRSVDAFLARIINGEVPPALPRNKSTEAEPQQEAA